MFYCRICCYCRLQYIVKLELKYLHLFRFIMIIIPHNSVSSLINLNTHKSDHHFDLVKPALNTYQEYYFNHSRSKVIPGARLFQEQGYSRSKVIPGARLFQEQGYSRSKVIPGARLFQEQGYSRSKVIPGARLFQEQGYSRSKVIPGARLFQEQGYSRSKVIPGARLFQEQGYLD